MTDLDHLRATVGEALEAWEKSSVDCPPPPTLALMADALYGIRERLTDLADEWDRGRLPSTREHGRRVREVLYPPVVEPEEP